MRCPSSLKSKFLSNALNFLSDITAPPGFYHPYLTLPNIIRLLKSNAQLLFTYRITYASTICPIYMVCASRLAIGSDPSMSCGYSSGMFSGSHVSFLFTVFPILVISLFPARPSSLVFRRLRLSGDAYTLCFITQENAFAVRKSASLK